MKETLKLALEALEKVSKRSVIMGSTGDYREGQLDALSSVSQDVALFITAIKEALAQEQEPVAWNVIDPTGKIVATEENAIRGWARIHGYKLTVEGLLGFHEKGWRVVPATTPQQRTWVGLTDEEKLVANQMWRVMDADGFIKAIEAKLKEKNTRQDGECKYCTHSCPACDARRQSNVLP